MADAHNKASLKNKQVFTTGEAAKVCKVSQQTIIRCFDSGRLQGFKVPGSRFRRIPRPELLRFMQQNDMDMSRLQEGPLRVLVVGVSPLQSDAIINEHARGRRIDIRHTDDAWSSGYMTHKFKPNLILINPTSSGVDESVIKTTTSENPELKDSIIVTVSVHREDGTSFGNGNHTDAIKHAVMQLMGA